MNGTELTNTGVIGDLPEHVLWGDEMRYNLRLVDALMQAGAAGVYNTPPPTPADGMRVIIGPSPTNDFANNAGRFAHFNGVTHSWDIYGPRLGWGAYLASTRQVVRWNGNTGWAPDQSALNVQAFGATGDGATDDTAAVVAALAAAPAGSRVHFPTGTYLLSTMTPYALTKVLWLSGDGMGNSTIKGVGTTNLLQISANFRCSDLTFDTWGQVLDFSSIATVLDKILLEDVEIKNFGKAIYGHSVTTGVGFRGLTVRGCRLSTGTSYGIYLDMPVMERVHLHHNEILNVVQRGIDMGGNALGFADDRGEYLIDHNIVDGVTNVGASSMGIICYGWRAIIDGNVVRNITRTPTLSVPTDSDCDGIYTKCRYSEIVNNLLIDAGQAEAFINVKGGAKRETVVQPFGYVAKVENNILLDTQSKFNNYTVDPTTDTFTAVSLGAAIAHGMSVGDLIRFTTSSVLPAPLVANTSYYVRTVPDPTTFTVSTTTPGGALLNITTAGSGTQGVTRFPVSGGNVWKRSNGIKLATSEVVCVNNYLEGICDAGIYFDSDSGSDAPDNNLVVRGNYIKDHVGRAAISIFGRGNHISVTDNRIDTVHGIFLGGQTMGIDLSNKEGTDLDVSRNRISNIVANAGTPIGISMSPSSLSLTFSADMNTDAITTVSSSDLSTPTAHAFGVNDPIKFIDIGSGVPGGLVSGTLYYVRDVLDPHRFTVSATPGGALIDLTSSTVGSDTLVYKIVQLSGWTVADNYIDGAHYGIQFTWNESVVAVDSVFVRHNTGRNINGNVVPNSGDLVKFSDSPTNLVHQTYNAVTGVIGLTRTGSNSSPMVELNKDSAAGAVQPQNFRLIAADDGAGNRTWLALETTATETHLAAGKDGSATVPSLFVRINGVNYWRFFGGASADGSFRPETDAVTDIGTLSKRVHQIFAGSTDASATKRSGLVLSPGDSTGGYLQIGAYYLWVDSSGRLRIKSGAPASDTDGTVVGTQS